MNNRNPDIVELPRPTCPDLPVPEPLPMVTGVRASTFRPRGARPDRRRMPGAIDEASNENGKDLGNLRVFFLFFIPNGTVEFINKITN